MAIAVQQEDIFERTRHYESGQSLPAAIESAEYAKTLLNAIVDYVRPGIRESEVKEYTARCFAEHNVERLWHQPYIRFGQHTLLTYREKTSEDFLLGDEDIAFIDIGVVRGGIEGDAGKTMVFGKNAGYERLRVASENIFFEALAFWRKENPDGMALYAYIHQLADKMQVRFNLDPAGHLIGAFPHRGWKEGLNHYPEKIAAGTWILEIQICDQQRRFGAFYEDLLY